MGQKPVQDPPNQAQRSLLAKGPNYTIAPRHPPHLEYITAIEYECQTLNQQDAETLRVYINRVLRSSHPHKSNLNNTEQQATGELIRDKTRIILTADKGVTMVVMDRQEYIDKANNLLGQLAYRPIPKDPSSKIKAKLITILRKAKKETGLDDCTNKYMYCMGSSAPKFHWLP